MATVKLHAYSGDHNGFESCDFRGDKYVGRDQGDSHRTLAEWEYGPDVETNEHIEDVLENGPEWNQMTARLLNGFQMPFEITVLLGMMGAGEKLRLGVWDK